MGRKIQRDGHTISLGSRVPYAAGGQVVVSNAATGVNFGASDPRKDGAAVPELPKYL